MVENQVELKTRASVEFAEASVLDAIVPAVPGIDIEAAFRDWDGATPDQGSSLLPFIDQRQFLLFGKMPVLLNLRGLSSYSFLG